MIFLTAAVLVAGGVVLAAGAYANSVTYSGQGLTADGFGGYDLNRELCGIENGADADGPYLLWVLTASKSNNADITGPWGTATMTKFGNGTFKYISGWYDPSTLPGNVTATYDGTAKNAQLVISHGCRPFQQGAWCSPGFWRQEHHLWAWAATGIAPTELYSAHFGAAPSLSKKGLKDGANPDPTLWEVLQNPQWYGGEAFNNVGDLLSEAHPDVDFQGDRVEDSCPL